MTDPLLPLNALRAFLIAAKHESFLLAGRQLNVSPGAISRHVRRWRGISAPRFSDGIQTVWC